MRQFTWETYYDGFGDWAESTRMRYLSGLTGFGPADQVCDVAESFDEEKNASAFLCKAIAAGVRFTAEQVIDLSLYVDQAALSQAAESVTGRFSRDQLEELDGLVDDEVFRRISRKSGIDLSDPFGTSILEAVKAVNEMDLSMLDAPAAPPVKKAEKPGFFTKLAAAVGITGTLLGGKGSEKPRKPGRRCNGDCANCPPHYGYRYGRWYYGHDHTEGCQFGGNCGGGRD